MFNKRSYSIIDSGILFEFYFKVENLKLLPGDYKVQVSSKGISYFQHKNLDVSYFIALEPESTYNS